MTKTVVRYLNKLGQVVDQIVFPGYEYAVMSAIQKVYGKAELIIEQDGVEYCMP